MPPKFQLDFDDIDPEMSISATWSIDMNGTMNHKPTGLKISEATGITAPGQEFTLCAKDIEYEEGVHLGAGACGQVMKGWITKGERVPVAIKTIKVDAKEKRAQLLNEIKGLLQAQWSPHLVHWYGGFPSKSTSTVHVVLEFMDRGSLADLKKRVAPGGVPARELAGVCVQVLQGLNFLHEAKMLHRDIKPENILHKSDGVVKLTDFGISKELTQTADVAVTFMGTVTYMSPERCMGEDYGYKSDIWSVGMVLFELASGKYPFEDISTFPALFQALMDKPEPRLGGVAPDGKPYAPDLADLVGRCLTRDLGERPETAELLAHDLCTKDVIRIEELGAYFSSLS